MKDVKLFIWEAVSSVKSHRYLHYGGMGETAVYSGSSLFSKDTPSGLDM